MLFRRPDEDAFDCHVAGAAKKVRARFCFLSYLNSTLRIDFALMNVYACAIILELEFFLNLFSANYSLLTSSSITGMFARLLEI